MTDNLTPGYKRPPNPSQFKPGKSGNPNGRPKGSRNLQTDLAQMMNKKVAIRENGKRKRITRQQAMLLSLFEKAAHGDVKAASQLFTMLMKFGIHDVAPPEPKPLTDNDRAIVENFLRRNSLATKGENES